MKMKHPTADVEVEQAGYDFTSIDYTRKGIFPLYEPLTGEYDPERSIAITTNIKAITKTEICRGITATVTVGDNE